MNAMNQTGAFVADRINGLKRNPNEAITRASLAKLRRGVGKAPGSVPELWVATLDGLPESLLGKGIGPSRAEFAVHAALTLFAMHQQSKDINEKCMHSRENSALGQALRKLALKDALANDLQSGVDDSRIKRRFDRVATSSNIGELSGHLRSLIQLLRDEEIPLDYCALAEDLYQYQSPEARDVVRRRWGRDYYRTTNHDGEDGATHDEP